MTDYKKLVKALRCCDKYALCNDCPIFETCDGDVDKAMAIAADAIEALQAQMPKRGEIVRCKECRWGHLCVTGQHLGLDGFCSKGEREVQE